MNTKGTNALLTCGLVAGPLQRPVQQFQGRPLGAGGQGVGRILQVGVQFLEQELQGLLGWAETFHGSSLSPWVGRGIARAGPGAAVDISFRVIHISEKGE